MGELFDLDDPAQTIYVRGAKSLRWRRTGGCKLTTKWWLGDTGWFVMHCGHPTALFPWAAYDAGGALIRDSNGRAFMHVADARDAIMLRYLQAEAATPATIRRRPAE
jgi:hypothetical protein